MQRKETFRWFDGWLEKAVKKNAAHIHIYMANEWSATMTTTSKRDSCLIIFVGQVLIPFGMTLIFNWFSSWYLLCIKCSHCMQYINSYIIKGTVRILNHKIADNFKNVGGLSSLVGFYSFFVFGFDTKWWKDPLKLF